MQKSAKNRFLLVLVLVAFPACIIGTWPTPEERSPEDPIRQGTELAPETCDKKDNDADGTVDEGCVCDADPRGCVGVVGEQCSLGVQWCVDGLWSECENLDLPFVPAQTPGVTIESVVPATLERGSTETVTVIAVPQTRCPGIQVLRVKVSLAASDPVMRVRSMANDDADHPDTVAGDGRFSAELDNVFGPGVLAQTLTVQVTAAVGGADKTATTTIDLVDP